MAKLGEFHVAKREADPDAEPLTFDFEGETFTVAEHVSLIVLSDFAEAASSGLDTAEMDGLVAMKALLQQVVIDEDAERFLATARKSRAQGDDLMPIVQAVIEATTGKDTAKPSDSLPGQLPIGESSRESSSSAASSPFGKVPPIQMDERIKALQTVDEAGLSLVG